MSGEEDPRARAALTQCAALLSELADLERQIDRGLESGQPRPAEQIVAWLEEIEATACALLDNRVTRPSLGWHVRGVAARLLDKPDAAERAFVEGVRMQPFVWWRWTELLHVRFHRDGWAGAEAAARRVVELERRRASAWSSLAIALLGLDGRDEARDAVLRALSLDENDSVAHMLMPELGLPEKNMEGD